MGGGGGVQNREQRTENREQRADSGKGVYDFDAAAEC